MATLILRGSNHVLRKLGTTTAGNALYRWVKMTPIPAPDIPLEEIMFTPENESHAVGRTAIALKEAAALDPSLPEAEFQAEMQIQDAYWSGFSVYPPGSKAWFLGKDMVNWMNQGLNEHDYIAWAKSQLSKTFDEMLLPSEWHTLGKP